MAHSPRKNRQHAGGRGHPENRRDALPLFESLEQRLLLSSLPVTAGTASFDLADTFLLHSNPTATKTIYLDFDGHTTTNPIWTTYNNGNPIVTPAFNSEGDASSFTNRELVEIQKMWEMVSEDFIPFDVNVTTEEPPVDWLMRDAQDPTDVRWGQRCVIGGTGAWWGDSGGVGFITFRSEKDLECFSFSDNLYNSVKNVAEVTSHEVGHTLRLGHDGAPGVTYYAGHGDWAPIMGKAYSKAVSQWSKGEYDGATNQQDDLAIIADPSWSGFGYRTDDHGNDDLTASSLDINLDATAFDWGIIEQNTDVDFFSFTTMAGTVNLDIEAFYRSPDLDILARLYDSSGVLITSRNPSNSLDATFSLSLAAGTYFVSVEGGDDADYSDYASLGQYTITGNIITPGVSLTGADEYLFEGGLVSTYDVALTTAPAGSVEVTVTADAQSEVSLDGVNFASSQVLTFTSTAAQTVHVRAIDDASNEGVHASTLSHAVTATNDATNYPTSMAIDDVTYSLIDNDGGAVDVIFDDSDFMAAGVHTYTDSGDWNTGGQGYNDGNRNNNDQNGQDVATWTFRVAPGTYDVAVTWKEDVNRATDSPFRVLDGTTEVASLDVNQELAPVADYVSGGKNFELLFYQLNIASGTLVVELSNDANGYVIADAVRVMTAGPDTIPPTADLANPVDGGSIDPAALNAMGYIEVDFDDAGGGVDAATITGDELTISGTGVGTAVLDSGAPTLVSGTTYRYGFTGSFVVGAVNVNFVAGSFADLATNVNVLETESFTVEAAAFVQIIDDGDAEFALTGDWGSGTSGGYQDDVRHNYTQNDSDTATWTFTNLASGTYEVAITWKNSSNRATNSPFRVLDNAAQVGSTTVNQELLPTADYTIGGRPFEIVFASVSINSGTMVVELSNIGANEFVVADGVRIEQLTSGPDTVAPTADLASPTNGGSIEAATLNAQGYIEVTFADLGDGVDASTITGDELTISGTGVGTAVLNSGAPTNVSGTTYRYGFTGSFVDGNVDVSFVAGTFADLASNTNEAEGESFTIAPAPTVYIMDDGDTGFATTGAGWEVGGQGYEDDNIHTDSGLASEIATWTFTGLAAGDYEVAITWHGSSNRATNSPFRVLDNTTQVASTTVNQENMPTADYVIGGKNFQIVFASVTVNSGTMVVELNADANQFVIADAVRIELTASPAALPDGSDSDGASQQLPEQAVGLTTSPAILGLTLAQLGTAGRSNVRAERRLAGGSQANADFAVTAFGAVAPPLASQAAGGDVLFSRTSDISLLPSPATGEAAASQFDDILDLLGEIGPAQTL